MKKLQAALAFLLILTLLTGCAVSAAMLPEEQHPIPAPTQPAAERLTAAEARAIALADAGLTAETVSKLRTEFEIDDGIPEYEVDFRSGDYEYDYTIHAETGAVRSRSKEFDPPAVLPTEPPPHATEPVREAPVQPPAAEKAAAEKITADRAVEIALAHVGLSRADVTRLEVELDTDDGAAEYDVEFHHGKMEYSFEIHAQTGKILDFDRDD